MTTDNNINPTPTWRPLRPIAAMLSGLFHPLTMMVWLVTLVMLGFASPLTYPSPVVRYVIGTVAFMTMGVPLLFYGLLRLLGVVKRGEAGSRRTRVMMLVTMALCFTCCGVVFDGIVVLFLIRKMLYTATAVVAVLLACELFYPLCPYTTALGALLGMMWMLLVVGNVALLVPFIVGIVATGLLATSRLVLTDRKVASVVLGAPVGFAVAAIVLVLI